MTGRVNRFGDKVSVVELTRYFPVELLREPHGLDEVMLSLGSYVEVPRLYVGEE
eukprot:CAMPEP_0176499206 /NCGR_PEP_ID=MMETSP0200_2-20121128/12794_1 /TAXON_ID=947934 /ORGANISM="Chaetoceros sp., Strain GSL56" /LENGTH=53 /DNA_ID=CAMNT_0017897591 /DNA_START=37 /DNA_END=198 /DNA_ORIENTATION=-